MTNLITLVGIAADYRRERVTIFATTHFANRIDSLLLAAIDQHDPHPPTTFDPLVSTRRSRDGWICDTRNMVCPVSDSDI